jgi:hypothetical protein
MVKADPAATAFTKVVLGPCHYRAIHSGHDRSRADNHGQRRSSLDLRRSSSSQVTTSPDLALGAGVGGGLHWPCHARLAEPVLVAARGRSAEGVRDQTGPLVDRLAGAAPCWVTCAP